MSSRRLCSFCRHVRSWTVPLTCDAFPNGIPAALLNHERDHREPYPGDDGIRFWPYAGITVDQLETVVQLLEALDSEADQRADREQAPPDS